jgi:hypothetical protein
MLLDMTYRVGQGCEEKFPEVDRIIILDLVETISPLSLSDFVLVEACKPGAHRSQTVGHAQRSNVLENGEDPLLRLSRPEILL